MKSKVLFFLSAILFMLSFSSCWVEAAGKKHKVEGGIHRTKNKPNTGKK